MLEASPVTASIAVTSLETIFSAARFSSTLRVLSAWPLLPQAVRIRDEPATRMRRRMSYSEKGQGQKKEAAGITGSLLKRQRLHKGGVKLHRVVGRRVRRRRRVRRG